LAETPSDGRLWKSTQGVEIMIRSMNTAKPGSAWDTWQKAGKQWRMETWATGKGALLIAAVAFASGASGDNERQAKKRAFIEGATITS
tara:strand:+ start:310 stop:573 length:264 start_codon:yes stop_codon:yes gene_type:complete